MSLQMINFVPFYSGIPLPGRYPEKTIVQEDKCVPVFIAALFAIARMWKQPKCPSTDEWMCGHELGEGGGAELGDWN